MAGWKEHSEILLLNSPVLYASCAHQASEEFAREIHAARTGIGRNPDLSAVDFGVGKSIQVDREKDVGVVVVRDPRSVGQREIFVSIARHQNVRELRHKVLDALRDVESQSLLEQFAKEGVVRRGATCLCCATMAWINYDNR
jgi:hypothetical protein